jgi:proteasome beta subunit
MEKELMKGTTTVGVVFKDGVVLGSEHRATMGTLIAHKNTQKLIKIHENIGLTTAGLVGDAQLLARYLSAEVELYNLKRDYPMSIKAASTLMANILSARRYFPYWVQLVIGGVDQEGGHVYSLDAAGGSIPDEYVTTGSGCPYVYGVLEDHYKPKMAENDAVDTVIRGLNAAIRRDAASGNGMDVAVIKSTGWKDTTKTDIDRRLKKMGLN